MGRNHGYTEFDATVEICIYCGNPWEEMDHALPYSFRNTIVAVNYILVPACKECNRILGNRWHHTLDDRINYVKKKLYRKYTDIIEMPDWSTDELYDMSSKMQEGIIRSMELKKHIITRIAFDYFIWEELGRPTSILP